MKQSIVLSILLLLLSSSSLITPIHARNKSNPAKTPSLSPVVSPAPGPSNSDCSSVIFSMLDCLSYLTTGSNETKPTKSCCVGIETVIAYNPQCICAGLDSGKQMGVDLNTTRALSTPKACKLAITPPHCGLINAATPGASVPVVSPVSPSSGTPTTSPSTTNTPATSPTSAEPTTETAPSPSKSGSNNLSVPVLTLVAIIGFSAFLINFSV